MKLPPWLVLIPIALLSACERKGGGGSTLETPDHVIEESTDEVAASPENPQVVHGDIFEDYFAAFTIERPGPGWRFLTEDKARELNPDAMVAAINPELGAFFAVIFESIAGASIEDYAQLIFDPTTPLGDPSVPTTFGNIGELPATHREVTSSIGGTDFRMRVSAVKRGDHFYQILGWSMEPRFARASADIEKFIASFRPAEGREPAIQANVDTADDDGFGWRITDGVYDNAAFGFRIARPEGCRIMSQAELINIAPESSVGIAGGMGRFYQTWVIERDGGEAFLEYQLEESALALAGTLGERRPVEIGGLPATEVTIDKATSGAIPMSFRITWLERGDMLYRLLSWWPPEHEEAAAPILESSYDAVTWMSESERSSVADALRGGDPGNAVGLGFALRGGVFHDFENGYRLTLPDPVLFETHTIATKQADEIGEARLVFTALPTSSYGEVIAGDIGPGIHADYHDARLEGVANLGEVRTLTVGGNDFLLTPYQSLLGDSDVFHLYASNDSGAGEIFELWLTALHTDHAAMEEELRTLLAGFERPEGGMNIEVKEVGVISDQRLGFTFGLPRGWSEKPNAPTGFENLGAFRMAGDEETNIGILALCSPLGVNLDLAAAAMLENIAGNLTGATETPEEEATLGGLPATRKVISGQGGGRPVECTLWTAMRGNTGYVLFIVDEASLPALQIRTIAEGFSLLE